MGNNKCFMGSSLQFIALLSVIIGLSYATYPTHLYAHTISPTIVLPDIGWDSSPGFPPKEKNGIVKFNPSSGKLSMKGKVVSFIPKSISGPLVGGNVSIFSSLTSVTVNPGLIHADFDTTSGANKNPFGYDVAVFDSKNKLAIGGNLAGLTIYGVIGSNISSGGALFTPLGGYLLPDFLPGPAGIVHLEFNAIPKWSAKSYNKPWTTEFIGDIGPVVPEPVVPEPATIALLGAGLLGFLGYRRFWRRN